MYTQSGGVHGEYRDANNAGIPQSEFPQKEGIHMNEAINLQDAILKEVRRDRVPVTLFLMNGFQLRGVITGYDSFVVVLVTDGRQQMIDKHAISALAPVKPLKAAAVPA